ncbi:MAG: ribonuclease P protein component [Synergistaceae bacterium]|nr:ribonuclease P protein component [Synergistaceae bacterium]
MRLQKSWEFDAVFRAGRRLKGELVRINYLYRDGGTRVGVTAGKRIGGAVKRVRGRRMLRETLRRLMPWIREGLWIVASLRKRALESDAVSIYYDTARLLEITGLMSDDWNGADWRVDDRRIFRGT